MPWLQTASGKKFDLLDPTVEMVVVGDIAVALSRINRFTGHAAISVAEHCCNVAEYLWARYHNPVLALAGLLHDAHEAYVGDISTPMIQALGCKTQLRYLKDKVDAVICEALAPGHAHGVLGMISSSLLKEADLRMLLSERAAGLGSPAEPWNCELPPLNLKPIGMYIEILPAAEAGARWLEDLAKYLEEIEIRMGDRG
jgi:uncharacterized protein